ncbi:hypothetical protein [Mesorhizobium sp.]|uniref:hypothetical protein n=1 Tax=Mesorhizobium sp. TaxID=1871066 RepID=UPI000FE7FB54|nr:hypothetical protein [Mesorhizobium sp.]RWB69706.1 MAG: hypothetical protein EOQ49_19710 [Mesorhizobium sp.]
MDRGDTILHAVRHLYDAVLEPQGWAKALPSVVGAVSGDRTVLLGQDLRTGRVEFTAGCGFSPEIAAAFAPACEDGKLAPWLNAFGPDIALPSSVVVPDRIFARSEFYNEIVRATGTFYAATAAPRYARHCRAFIALGSDNYDVEQIETLQELVPHLATALRVRRQFGEADLSLRDVYAVLDHLRVPELRWSNSASQGREDEARAPAASIQKWAGPTFGQQIRN